MLLKRLLGGYALFFALNAALVYLLTGLLRTPLIFVVLDQAFPQNCLGEVVQELVMLGQVSLLVAIVFLCVAAMLREDNGSTIAAGHPDVEDRNRDFPASSRRTRAHQPPGTLLRSASSDSEKDESPEIERWENEGGRVS
jgi:hypothetical protein